ncbi:peptide chain release factor N(5)-glutamine methyltransferase [Mesonia maritima]|uniref:Release factor glutamine methyltransferase n=1 Tax=Mesonia maritima TaxID=1793873 RepID=A0ABU1K3Y9_9FLAO|nr:peptide chain release factor N(5)-glutamine methyltransferase [Mesonia maritima]MDR6300334.1 release factor glutamine methyltransferase [Mesonia maritima]
MQLNQLKLEFINALQNTFPSTEIESFFYLLTEAYLKMNRLEVALNSDTTITEKNKELFFKAIERLKNHEPIQYIIGNTEFYGLPFKVNRNVLIPRPETEELIEWIIQDIKKITEKNSTFKILDIGTGSGCIPISLAKELPKANVSSIDISAKAIELAKLNAKINNVSVTFFQQDILVTEDLEKKYEVIVSNPPYVRNLEKEQMQKNVLDYEPEIALYVDNEDPLIFYRKIAQLAKNALTENGALYFEINQYLAEELKQLLQKEGFQQIELKKDIYENYRMCKATL